jgi:hypothetical protein
MFWIPPKLLLVALAACVILFFVSPVDSPLQLRGAGDDTIINKQLVQVIISLIVLCSALWVIISKRYASADRHWAFGLVGTIVGFWIHT